MLTHQTAVTSRRDYLTGYTPAMDIRENVPLSPLTTFGIGGNARYFCEAADEADVREALSWARAKGVSFFVIAGGSNLLVPDEGLDGLVIRMSGDRFSMMDLVGPSSGLEAQAGCNLLTLIRAAAEAGCGGWEKLAGIPGTIGGAVRGNAGAFGPEIKDFVTWVRAINTKTEEVHEFSNAECEFDYRMSFFKKNPEWIILDVQARLAQMEPGDILTTIEETIAEREKRHIQDVKAAGSYFMNPVAPQHIVNLFETEKAAQSRGGRVPAGWLIEKAGMKGQKEGDAQVSPMQANYIINTGNATAAEVRTLAERVRAAVSKESGVNLREEAVVF